MPDRKNQDRGEDATPEQLPSVMQEKINPFQEADPDELVHSGAAVSPAESPEADPDDVVHRRPAPSTGKRSEQDPDDLVHGG